ncbi:MAG TPA: hypothetical protein VFC78_12625 [Tepidisphaeraceae bacterium]|nr:hypothetical protein [Tepidisphaeraceae bacterium]
MEKRTFPSLVWYLVASVFALAVLGVGIYLLAQPAHDNWSMLAAGCICLVLVGVAWPITRAISAQHAGTREEMFQPICERLDQLAILLNLMSEQQLLSDRAKSVAYRENDREALRRAMHEEMGRLDWEAALALADDMERLFGYKSEADRMRKEINDKRQDLVRKQVNEVVQSIDKHTRSEQWNNAVREAEKLIRTFPDNEQVRNLPHEIDNRRLAHKKQLLQNWHDAVARHDVDGSIEILKQLDPYLTPAEAEGMQETVRGVFKEKLNNLGAQFANCYKAEKWTEALHLGEQITAEFPNSRMAQEVRERMEILRKRAGEPAGVGA